MSKRVFQLRKKLDAGSTVPGDQAVSQATLPKQHSTVENKSHLSNVTAKQQQAAELDNFSQRVE